MRIFPILGWMLFPGCWAVTAPKAVRGPAGGSVAVWCQYREGFEDNPKFWCQKGGLVAVWSCSNGHIVETDGSEVEVTRGRVSIRDNRTQRAFTVTVENLTLADAGTYLCGVGKRWDFDPTATVELTVSPATTSPPPTIRSSSPTVQPASSSPSISSSLWTTAEEGKSSFSTNQDPAASEDRAPDPDILLHILLPCVLLVLILFLLAAVMLVRVSKKRKKELSEASVQRDKNINLSNLQPIYANVEQRPKTTRPAKPPEETLYSLVKQPPKH
ncbi:CMRF35-like molecule 2 [Mauremys mutica]|uniref:CMRF35-like molecule 2 n=1 Tax=Mauremys mutica TaxID=74926 RepID=UPI001D15EC04|nr:CMRF35-like molecule 2 [Mauremys mutica]